LYLPSNWSWSPCYSPVPVLPMFASKKHSNLLRMTYAVIYIREKTLAQFDVWIFFWFFFSLYWVDSPSNDRSREDIRFASSDGNYLLVKENATCIGLKKRNTTRHGVCTSTIVLLGNFAIARTTYQCDNEVEFVHLSEPWCSVL
jgi:hypothetical protein